MFLLDTNVVSELRKVRTGKPDIRVEAWADGVSLTDLYLSAITIHELQVGVLRAERKTPERGAILRAWLDDRVLPGFSGRVIPIDRAVALQCARLNVPDTRPILDSLIAATALVHGMTVVTRNVADFVSTGVPIVNPWQP